MPWGYTTVKIISAAGEFIDAAMTAFPKQAAAMAHSGNDSTLDAPYAGDYEARSIITNARTKRGSSRPVVEKHNLCAITPPIIPPTSTSWRVLYDSQLAVEAQMLWFFPRRYHILQQRRNAVRPGHLTTARDQYRSVLWDEVH